MTLFYSSLKKYNTSARNIFREAFYYHYLQTVKVKCKSVDVVFLVLQKVHRPIKITDWLKSWFIMEHNYQIKLLEPYYRLSTDFIILKVCSYKQSKFCVKLCLIKYIKQKKSKDFVLI